MFVYLSVCTEGSHKPLNDWHWLQWSLLKVQGSNLGGESSPPKTNFQKIKISLELKESTEGRTKIAQ